MAIHIPRRIPGWRSRSLVVQADSGAFYRESRQELDGVKAAPIQSVTWIAVPAGEHRVAAILAGESWVRSA